MHDELDRIRLIRLRTWNSCRPLISSSQSVFSFSCGSFSSCRVALQLQRLRRRLLHLQFAVFRVIELIVAIAEVRFAVVIIGEEY